jgi:hypothetical protein
MIAKRFRCENSAIVSLQSDCAAIAKRSGSEYCCDLTAIVQLFRCDRTVIAKRLQSDCIYYLLLSSSRAIVQRLNCDCEAIELRLRTILQRFCSDNSATVQQCAFSKLLRSASNAIAIRSCRDCTLTSEDCSEVSQRSTAMAQLGEAIAQELRNDYTAFATQLCSVDSVQCDCTSILWSCEVCRPTRPHIYRSFTVLHINNQNYNYNYNHNHNHNHNQLVLFAIVTFTTTSRQFPECAGIDR